MFSDNVHFWNERKLLLKPVFPWELVQIGNCGSPIETDAGWLVLSHGVGPMRKYCIGAFLLDRDDPCKVIGRLREPLLKPNQNEREGYVPNVVYTCGALVHNGELIIPYGLADHATGFATVPLAEVLAAMDYGIRMKIMVTHSTRYRYDFPVSLEPHIFRLRPRMTSAQRLLAFDIQIAPMPAGTTECLDQDGNLAINAWFEASTQDLSVTSRFTVEMLRQNPFDYVLAGRIVESSAVVSGAAVRRAHFLPA